MTRATPLAHLGTEFDNFLFAPVGEGRNGMLLTVVSALARLDLDPWQEAANFTAMSKETATRRLASMIAAVPDEPSARREPEKIAARLIALLPHRAGSTVPSPSAAPAGGAAANSPLIAFMVFMTLMLVLQFVMGSHQPPARGNDTQAPVSSTVTPQASAPISDR